MGPLPKRKLSKARKAKRRAHHALSLNHLLVCESCGEYHIAHQVCPKCGTYRGETILQIEED
jgi:large subunit ribosomal protein L32